MKKNYLKIILPTILAILLFILTIFLIIIPRFQQNIMDGKREMIKELTSTAWSILAKYESDERDGLLTREEAQEIAASRVEYLRYGEENKDYFWITDMTPVMIMHPFRKDLNNQDLTNFTDPHGKKLFVEFVETVKKSEEGYVDYMWQWKDDSLNIVPKLSYVKIFKPWNWVIGTGIYIEDAKKEIASLTERMVYISIGISILIAFLLLYIFKQSMNIEQKRIHAEEELHESREKYKTLVEAATEGLIMLVDGRISFSNNVISKLTGYESSELLNRSMNEIISRNSNYDVIDAFSKDTVKEGKFELNLINKNGGFVEVLVTSSTTTFYGKTVNIIIVKDVTADKKSGLSAIDYQKLISTLNVGFFKARIDSKGKFLFANETAIKILGFDSFEDLSDTHILGLLADADDRKNLKKALTDNGFLKNKILKIFRKNGEYSIVSISLVVLNGERSDEVVCDGIIEDITIRENEKKKANDLIAELKVNDFLFEQPVKNYLSKIYTLDVDSTLNEIVNLFSKRNTDCLLITKDEKDYIGIITNSDVQKRILHLNLNLNNPAYLIMSSPILFISENTSVLEAIRIGEEKKVNHLVVKNESDEVKGVLKTRDVYKILLNSVSFITANIRRSETNEELKQCYLNLQLLLKPIIKSEVSVKYISQITTAFSDSVTRRLIELAVSELGNPPVDFEFISLGSDGRKEQTLYTDQDNAIIYDNVNKENEVATQEYFLRLGEKVCGGLNYIGFSYCIGNIMAKNPQWCKPLSVWEEYFANWISTPEPQNLLDATIFFDFRSIYSGGSLTDKLRKTITIFIKENPLFLYHLAYNTYNTKPLHLSSGNILSEKHADFIDLKLAVNPVIQFARAYSLQNNIWCTNTIERLIALKERQVLSTSTADEIIFAYDFLMKLRYRNQVELLENNMPLNNSLNARKLVDPEAYLLKKVLLSVPDFQNKIKTDFRITT